MTNYVYTLAGSEAVMSAPDSIGAALACAGLHMEMERAAGATVFDGQPSDGGKVVARINLRGLDPAPRSDLPESALLNVARYADALDELEIAPNGDDFNALYKLSQGHPYRRPHVDGR